MEKACSKCKAVKPLTEFAHYGKPVPKPRPECRECSRAMCRSYKARNREKISAYNKVYKAEHVEEISDYNKTYFKEHQDEIQTRVRRNRKNNPQFDLSVKLRDLVYRFFKGRTIKPGVELVGCDREFFLEWLQYQLDDTMTMENYADVWELDHVKPCKNFDLLNEDEKYECFHWSNTRPLLRKENRHKGDRITDEEIAEHDKIIKRFIEHVEGKGTQHNYTILVNE